MTTLVKSTGETKRNAWKLSACIATIFLSSISFQTVADTFISEIHYDNASTDVNEAIEISSDNSTDLSTWTLVLYNGSNGSVYNTISLPESPVPSASCGSAGGTVVINFPSNGIQNGSPDGIALVNGTTVESFISYEGSFEALEGPAIGMISEDIGVSESGSTLPSESLQLINGIWSTPSENSFGVCTTEVTGGIPPSPTPSPTPIPEIEVSISEIHYDNSGADQGEAIELEGPGEALVDGWQIVLYNGSNSEAYLTRELSGVFNAAEGCEIGSFVSEISGIQNGSPDAIALIDPDGEVKEFISYEGTLTAVNGPAAGMTSTDIDVAETSSTPVGYSLQKIDGIWQAPSFNTFGACNNPEFSNEVTPIHQIQGSGEQVTSQAVFTVEAIVVADYQDSEQLRGFFIQEEDADADSDPNTSEGILVFCSACTTDVAVGDLVRVTGLANEFFGMSQLTATFESDVEVLSSANPLPTPASLNLPVATEASDLASAADDINAYYETVEGMLVTVDSELSVAEYFQLSRFGQVVLSAAGRPRQFTDANLPSEAGYIAHQIDLAARRLILDDDNNSQNAALFNDLPVFYPTPGFAVDNYFRGGDIIENLTGVLHWSWAGSGGTDAWRIRPVPEVYEYNFVETNARTVSPREVGGDLNVASFNVLNYFTTIDFGPAACGPNQNLGCRGADSPEELLCQTQKIVAAICALDADIVGLMELQNAIPGMIETPIASLTSAINESCPRYAAIETGPIGTDAISVGIIYKPDTVMPYGTTAILDDISFTDPNNTGQDKNRPALAQSFKHFTSERVVTVSVNHLKSKGSACGSGDDDTLTGQGNCNGTRTLAAQVQADWLAANPTEVYNNDYVLIIGDLNAYRNEDPITTLVHSGYTDLVDFYGGSEAYGYVFDGQLGYLDHALANENLLPLITDVAEWHINADEVNLLDYNDTVRDASEASFEAKPSALTLFAENAYRSSDHDPLVIGIEFPDLPLCNGREATIYVKDGTIIGGPDNGKLYQGVLNGSDSNDVINGTDSRDTIYANAGNDLVCGFAGDDRIKGGPGNDVLSGGADNDHIWGGPGADSIYGDQGNDKAHGGSEMNECDAEKTIACKN